MAMGDQRSEHQSTAAGGGAGAQSTDEWDGLKGDVGQIADTAVEQGRHLLDSAKGQVTGFVDGRKNDAAQLIVDLANTIRESGRSLGGPSNVTALIDGAAGRLEQVADTVRSRDLADILDDAEAAIRRRPATATVAAVAVGFLVARFLKSSAEDLRGHNQQQHRSGQGQPSANRTGARNTVQARV